MGDDLEEKTDAYEAKAMEILSFVKDSCGRYGAYFTNSSGSRVYRWVNKEWAELRLGETRERVEDENQSLEGIYHSLLRAESSKTIGDKFGEFSTLLSSVNIDYLTEEAHEHYDSIRDHIKVARETNRVFLKLEERWDTDPLWWYKKDAFEEMRHLDLDYLSTHNKGQFRFIEEFLRNKGLADEESFDWEDLREAIGPDFSRAVETEVSRFNERYRRSLGLIKEDPSREAVVGNLGSLVSFIHDFSERTITSYHAILNGVNRVVIYMDSYILRVTRELGWIKYRPVSLGNEIRYALMAIRIRDLREVLPEERIEVKGEKASLKGILRRLKRKGP